MVFEQLVKSASKIKLGDNEISVSKTALSFGDNFYPILSNTEYIEIFLDRATNQVGFKPSMKTDNSFRLQKDKSNAETSKRLGLGLCKINKMVAKGRYFARVNENGLIVMSVKEIADYNATPITKKAVVKENAESLVAEI